MITRLAPQPIRTPSVPPSLMMILAPNLSRRVMRCGSTQPPPALRNARLSQWPQTVVMSSPGVVTNKMAVALVSTDKDTTAMAVPSVVSSRSIQPPPTASTGPLPRWTQTATSSLPGVATVKTVVAGEFMASATTAMALPSAQNSE